jgi:phosphate transport system protein
MFLDRSETTIGEIFVLNNSIKKGTDDTIHNLMNEMKSNAKAVVSGMNLVMVLKHLERISEHCTNIAEHVHFMINAKIIKHEKFDDKQQ